ncbi:MAG: MASE3 domain-containing protein, partial [Methylococcaceae bacterium]
MLYAISRYNYLLFHSLADGLSIVIAACVFVIIWNSRHLLDNDYYLYLGITFLFWAFLDFIHLLGNKNMGVFTAHGNLGPTFYIASRYILSISLLIAPLFIKRKLNTTLMYAVYSLITLLILLSIFYWQIFPVCIVDGVGLTPFKVVSDYIICFILLGSIGLMIIKRRLFDSRVLWLIVTSIILSIATGLSFTLYTDPFGIMNMTGHLLQMASFYLIYLALIETSLSRPQDILYQKLKQNEKKLADNVDQLEYANNELTKEITDRKQTEAALMVAEETYRNIFLNSQIGLFRTELQTGLILDANDTVAQFIGYPDRASLLAKPFTMVERYVDAYVRDEMISLLQAHGKIHNYEARFRRNDGSIIWIRFSAKIVREKGWMEGVSEDITERKQTEADKAELEAQNRQLQKSESLGRMAASIAHHFNNQLGAVIGNLEMAMDELPKGTSTHQTLTKAMKSAWSAADMSGLMLTYLGQSRDQRAQLDFSYSCSKILPLIEK